MANRLFLSLLLYGEALVFAAICNRFLEEELNLHWHGGGGIAAAAIVSIELLGLLVLGGFVSVLVGTMVPSLSPWRAALLGAALGLSCFHVATLLFSDQHLAISQSVLLVTLSLAAAAIKDVTSPWLFGLGLPVAMAGLGIAAYFARGVLQEQPWRLDHRIYELARQEDDAGLAAALGSLHAKLFPPDVDGFDFASLGPKQIGLILNSPAVARGPTVELFSAAFRGDAAAARTLMAADHPYLGSEARVTMAAVVAARAGHAAVLKELITEPYKVTVLAVTLRTLVLMRDRAAVRTFLEGGGYLDGRGKIDPRYYDYGFWIDFVHRLDEKADRDFAFGLCNLDALLVTRIVFGHHLDVEDLLLRGANVNGKTPAGTTPLSAFISVGRDDKDVLTALKRAGALARLKATPFSLAPVPGAVAKSPLWLLIDRREKDKQAMNTHDDSLELFLSMKPDLTETNEKGETPLEALLRIDPEQAMTLKRLLARH